MAKVHILRGTKANYNLVTDPSKKANGIYFATDTKEIIINGQSYGFNIDDHKSVQDIEMDQEKLGQIKITFTDSTTKNLTIPDVTTTYSGLMSPGDKITLEKVSAALGDDTEGGTLLYKENAGIGVLKEYKVSSDGSPISSSDTINSALGKLETSTTNLTSTIGTKRDGDTEPTGIFKIIEDDERVAAEALVDLNTRLGKPANDENETKASGVYSYIDDLLAWEELE